MFAWWKPNCPSQLWWMHRGIPNDCQPSVQNMIWQRRTCQANTFHPWLKNVPHLLTSTMSDHTFCAETDKRGAPGWCGLRIAVWVRVWVSMCFCCVSVCVCKWIVVWGTMQHAKPMWEVWRQGICCSQNEQGRKLLLLCFHVLWNCN